MWRRAADSKVDEEDGGVEAIDGEVVGTERRERSRAGEIRVRGGEEELVATVVAADMATGLGLF